jgi:hypothetical protein
MQRIRIRLNYWRNRRWGLVGLLVLGFSGPVYAQHYDKAIQAGSKDQVVTYWGSVKADCTAGVTPTVIVTQRPTHGTARIAQGRNLPRVRADDKRFHCNAPQHLLPTIQLRYTPEPGFVGTDYITTYVTYISGQHFTLTYTITVTKNPPPGGDIPASSF